jgi:hypothetical protein
MIFIYAGFLAAKFDSFVISLLQLVGWECFDEGPGGWVGAGNDVIVDDLVAPGIDLITAGLPGTIETFHGRLERRQFAVFRVAFHDVLIWWRALVPLASQTTFNGGAVVGVVASDQSVRWFGILADGAFVDAVFVHISVAIFQFLVGVQATEGLDGQTSIVLRAHGPEFATVECVTNVVTFAVVFAGNGAHGASVVGPSSAFVVKFTFFFRFTDIVSFAFVGTTPDVHPEMVSFGGATVPVLVIFPGVSGYEFLAFLRHATFVTEAQETAGVDGAFQYVTAALERFFEIESSFVVGEATFRCQLTIGARVPVTAAVHLGTFLVATSATLLSGGGVVGRSQIGEPQ